MKTFLVLCLLTSLAFLMTCEFRAPEQPAESLPNAEIEHGRDLVVAYGCVACHRIPGTNYPDRWIGPPLDHWKQRIIIAGKFPNTRENLMQWIRFPRQMDAKTAMPEVHMSENDAHDITSYLFSLE